MLALKNVSHSYGQTRVLSGATFAVKPKDCVCIIGDGGSGKSTMMRLLVREEDPTQGSVEVDGIKLTTVPPAVLQLYRRRIGIIYQEPVLLEHATAAENIALPLELFGAPQQIVERLTADLLKRLGLTKNAHLLAEQLSSSDRALVAIARAVALSPMIVLADEPLEHLDAKQRKAVVELLTAMQKNGTTLVLFSRSSDTARAFDARTVTLKNGAITAEVKAASGPVNSANTHRILEETEEKLQQIFEASDEPARPRPGTPKNDKKIKITSIGSGL